MTEVGIIPSNYEKEKYRRLGLSLLLVVSSETTSVSTIVSTVVATIVVVTVEAIWKSIVENFWTARLMIKQRLFKFTFNLAQIQG